MCPSFVLKYINHSKFSFFIPITKIRSLSLIFTFIIAIFPLNAIAQQIRIMPLGNSITHGQHGSDPS